ncbi:MAG: hypothetical protein ACREH8_00380 [Opitutaceae bacterium]
MLTPPKIARLLTRYLNAADAEQRARDVAEDMAAVGFVLQEDRSVPPEKWQALGARAQAEYLLPKTEFDLNGKDPDKAMEGSLLTRGNLLRLSQVVGLGRKWLPGLWPGAFQVSLLGREHLDAVNEVFWLKFWHGLGAVRRGPKANAAEPDTDWQLTLRFGELENTVNLEVKRRTGNLNAWFKKRVPRVSMAKVGHKLKPGDERTLNLAAIYRVKEKVQRSPALDGVVIWIEDNRGGKALLKIFKDEKRWAEALVKEPDPEDLMIAAFTSGTLCHPDEVPQFLERMVAAERFGVRPK